MPTNPRTPSTAGNRHVVLPLLEKKPAGIDLDEVRELKRLLDKPEN